MQDVNNFQKMPFGRGQAFKCRYRTDGEELQYIIGSVDHHMVGLINLKTGKRWGDPLEVNDAEELIPEEATELFKGLEIVAGLTVTTEETPKKPEPERTYRTGQSFLFKNPYDGSEDVYQIACAEGGKRRLICQAGDRLGMFWGNAVEVRHSGAITQAEFDKMKTDLTLIEEVVPTYRAVL